MMIRMLAGLAAVAATSCRPADEAPAKPHEVLVRVTGDPDEPLGELAVRAGSASATTNAEGSARLFIPGRDGSKIDLDVLCPPGFAPPPTVPKVTLLRTDRAPEYEIACRHLDRGIVVAVRTVPLTGVPVLYLEREIARTDDEGFALVRLEPNVGDTVTLTFDTSAERFRRARPENPERSFAVAENEGVYTIEQAFTVDRPKPPPAAKPRVAKRIE
jgi:hypothetical protein